MVSDGVSSNGSFSTNAFLDLANLIVTTATANFLDAGAATNTPSRYYRIRALP